MGALASSTSPRLFNAHSTHHPQKRDPTGPYSNSHTLGKGERGGTSPPPRSRVVFFSYHGGLGEGRSGTDPTPPRKWAPIYISTKSYIALGGGIGVVQNPTPPPPPERVSPFHMPHAITGGGVGPSVEPCPQLSLALLDERKLGGIGKGRMCRQ